jgi:hypothetical protein
MHGAEGAQFTQHLVEFALQALKLLGNRLRARPATRRTESRTKSWSAASSAHAWTATRSTRKSAATRAGRLAHVAAAARFGTSAGTATRTARRRNHATATSAVGIASPGGPVVVVIVSVAARRRFRRTAGATLQDKFRVIV